jgi:very-short-patch-repair endonuclease
MTARKSTLKPPVCGPSELEAMFAMQAKLLGLPAPQREYKFAPKRRWRFDFAWPELMLAVEIEGGVWSGGRHTSGVGFTADCEKYNEATILGWRVLRVTGQQVKGLQAYEWTKRLIYVSLQTA